MESASRQAQNFARKPASFWGSSARPTTIRSDEISLGVLLSWFGKRRSFVRQRKPKACGITRGRPFDAKAAE